MFRRCLSVGRSRITTTSRQQHQQQQRWLSGGGSGGYRQVNDNISSSRQQQQQNPLTSSRRHISVRADSTSTAAASSSSTAAKPNSNNLAASLNLSGTAGATDSTTHYTGEENAPTLHFLDHPRVLLDTVDGTITKCNELLDLLRPGTSGMTPQAKHDALDSTSNVLCLLLDPAEFVRQVHPSDAYKYYANEAFSKAHEYMCGVNGRSDLYDVLVELDKAPTKSATSSSSTEDDGHSIDEQARKNVTQLKRDMEGNGIHLPEADRKRIEQLNITKEELTMQFLNDGGSKDPFGTLRVLLDTRYTLARELGFDSYAEQQLRGTMLGNTENVWHFLCGLAHKYRPECERELALVTRHLGEVRSRDNITDVDKAKLVASLRGAAEDRQAPLYFTVANCVRGIQALCREVFGVHLVQRPFAPEEKFLPHAMKFHVFDNERRFTGVIIVDMFARASKHCQAAHLTVQLGCRPHQGVLSSVGLKEALGPRQYPVVVLTCNAGSMIRPAKKADGTLDPEGTVMMPHEVNTCFHEFGHALHTLFGQTTVQNLAGTRGPIDYVETFSQLFEQFLTDPQFLQLWATRVGTGQKISPEIVEQHNAASRMFTHLDTLDQINLSTIDQTLHGPRPFTVYFPHPDIDTNVSGGGGSSHGAGRLGKRTLGSQQEYGKGMYNFAKLVMDISVPMSLATPTEHGVLRTLSFEHLCSYPAGYYGYLYSLAVARRIWAKKFEGRTLNKEAGLALANTVLGHGAACDPVETIEQFLGDDLGDIDVWA